MMSRHHSHFLLLFNLFLFLLVVLHDLQPLGLDQTALLDVELFLCLQGESGFISEESSSTVLRRLALKQQNRVMKGLFFQALRF